MIRSCRIPPVLNRICDDDIHTALMVTMDGELLGSSTYKSKSNSSLSGRLRKDNEESLGTLLADIAADYQRLGRDFSALDSVRDSQPSSKSNSSDRQMFMLMEMDLGLVGISLVSAPVAPDTSSIGMAADENLSCWWVMAIATPTTPVGLIKARLQALAVYVQDAFSVLTEAT